MGDRKDWLEWHGPYDDPGSPLSARLAAVQEEIRRALPAAPAEPFRVVGVCAGQGRDLIPVLAERGDLAGRVRARLVELDPRNAALARRAAETAALSCVDIVEGDASYVGAYAGYVPADLVLLCGVFGNIPDADIFHTIACTPQLVAHRGIVIWTRNRRAPDLTPAIRRAFAGAGFREEAFLAPEGSLWSVGVARFEGRSAPADPAEKLFTFQDEPSPDGGRAAVRGSDVAAQGSTGT